VGGREGCGGHTWHIVFLLVFLGESFSTENKPRSWESRAKGTPFTVRGPTNVCSPGVVSVMADGLALEIVGWAALSFVPAVPKSGEWSVPCDWALVPGGCWCGPVVG
jgi:hypothetical protein